MHYETLTVSQATTKGKALIQNNIIFRRSCLACQFDREKHAFGPESVGALEKLGMKKKFKEPRDPKMDLWIQWNQKESSTITIYLGFQKSFAL